MSRVCIHIAGALLLAMPLACSGGGSSSDPGGPGEPFQFRTTSDVSVGVTVRLAGAPVVGASVSVVDVLTSGGGGDGRDGGPPWFSGGTGDDGVCSAIVSIPTHVERVDLVVHADGCRGRYTDEGLRTLWGPFAPSSRVTVRVADLGNLAVDLEDR